MDNIEARYADDRERRKKRAFVAQETIDRYSSMAETPDGIRLTEIKVRLKGENRSDVLVIVKGRAGYAPVIAFHAGETLGEALSGVANRLDEAKLKWKADEWQEKLDAEA